MDHTDSGPVRELDLGGGFSLRFTSWSPNRVLNPQYDGLPDVEKFGALVTCAHGIEGVITFDGPVQREFANQDTTAGRKQRPLWKVISWDPLTIEPSVDAGCCHGWIRNGLWESA